MPSRNLRAPPPEREPFVATGEPCDAGLAEIRHEIWIAEHRPHSGCVRRGRTRVIRARRKTERRRSVDFEQAMFGVFIGRR
ncbi:MAG TPA: hypothetical protein VF332_07060, partial [Vicinamibacterales bacterium]